MQVQIDPIDYEIVANRKTVKQDISKIHKTANRPQTSDLDIFSYINRSLINYNRYHHYIGHAGVKYSMAI